MENQSNKSSFFRLRHFSSRLVIRVFTASLFCLVLPLILYSLIAIRTDYNTTKQQLDKAQLNITKDRIHLLNQVMDIEFNSMTAINHLILDKQASPLELTKLLHGFADGELVSAIYYIDAKGKMIASSLEEEEGVDFSIFIGQNALAEQPEKIFVATDPSGKKGLFLSQTIYSLSDVGIQGFLLFDLRSEWLVSTIFSVRGLYDAEIVLVDPSNVIIASHKEAWIGQTLPNIPSQSVQTILYQGKEYLIVIEPIDGANFGIGNLIEKKNLFTAIQRTAVQFVVLLLVIIAIGATLILFFLSRLSEPIHRIHEAMQKVSDGDLTFKYKPLKLGFEINSVGEMFNETVKRLVAAMESAQRAQVKEEVYRKELALGHEVQHSLLPMISPRLDKIKVAGKFIPAKEVGGDFYDLIPSKNHRDLFCIADTAGKGVMACLYSLDLRSLLRAFFQSGESCAEIVINANEMLLHDTKDSGIFITAWVGLYDSLLGEIEYVNMGHPPAILKRSDGSIEMLSTDGIAFGVISLAQIEVKKTKLNSGDFLFLYTDGISEAMNERGEHYGIERLISFIRGIKTQDTEAIIDLIYENVQEFCGKSEQADDLTLMVTHYL